MKYTLTELGIKCEVIEGYAKTDISEIGKITNEVNHAWNAVFINNNWYFIDATWSTGNEESKPNQFLFNDVYFLIEPNHLIWSHFTDDKKWQLLDKPISNIAFFYSPIIHFGYYNSSLKPLLMKGIVKGKRIIELSFDEIDMSNTYYFQFSNSSANLETLEFIKKGNKYVAEIPYTYKKGKELSIFNDFEPCLTYKIN